MKRCSDCAVKEGELHWVGCDWEVCPICGGQRMCCDCKLKGKKRIPYGCVREIAAKVPYYSQEIIDTYVKPELLEAIKKGNW